MSIFRAPKLTTEYTGNYDEDMRRLWLEYNQKSAKMMNEFAIAFGIVGIVGVIVLIGVAL